MYRGAGGRRQVSGGAGQGADRGTTGGVQHRALIYMVTKIFYNLEVKNYGKTKTTKKEQR